ncbi:MAG: Sec-independent protein translocase protein TatB [Pseudomonadota bacterium]
MFDVSFSEIAMIGLIALLVVGPQKLPGLARTAGTWIGKVRRMAASVKADIDREFKTDELRKLLSQQQAEMQELRQIIDESRTTIETGIKQATGDPAYTPVAQPALTPTVAADAAPSNPAAAAAAAAPAPSQPHS